MDKEKKTGLTKRHWLGYMLRAGQPVMLSNFPERDNR